MAVVGEQLAAVEGWAAVGRRSGTVAAPATMVMIIRITEYLKNFNIYICTVPVYLRRKFFVLVCKSTL